MGSSEQHLDEQQLHQAGAAASPGVGAERRAMGAGGHFVLGDSSQPQQLRERPEMPTPPRLPCAPAALSSYLFGNLGVEI